MGLQKPIQNTPTTCNTYLHDYYAKAIAPEFNCNSVLLVVLLDTRLAGNVEHGTSGSSARNGDESSLGSGHREKKK